MLTLDDPGIQGIWTISSLVTRALVLKVFVNITGPILLSMATEDALAPAVDVHAEMISMFDQTHHSQVQLSFSFQCFLMFLAHVLYCFVLVCWFDYVWLFAVIWCYLHLFAFICIYMHLYDFIWFYIHFYAWLCMHMHLFAIFCNYMQLYEVLHAFLSFSKCVCVCVFLWLAWAKDTYHWQSALSCRRCAILAAEASEGSHWHHLLFGASEPCLLNLVQQKMHSFSLHGVMCSGSAE